MSFPSTRKAAYKQPLAFTHCHKCTAVQETARDFTELLRRVSICDFLILYRYGVPSVHSTDTKCNSSPPPNRPRFRHSVGQQADRHPTQLTRYNLGGRTVDCKWEECASVLPQINPGRERSTPRSTEGKTFSATSTMLCLHQALHARKVCVQLPGILSYEMHLHVHITEISSARCL